MDISPTQTRSPAVPVVTVRKCTQRHSRRTALPVQETSVADAFTRHEAAVELHALAGMDVPGGPLLHDRHIGAHDQCDTHAGR